MGYYERPEGESVIPDTISYLTAVILDMDGLMVDSEPLSANVWRAVLRDLGHALDDETLARMVGRRTSESAQIVLERFPLPLSGPELAARKSAYWQKVWQNGVPPRPGLFSFLEALAARNLPWAVATSSPHTYAASVLRQLSLAQRCGALACGDEVQHGKPAPDVYLLAAERLQVAPTHCLALEDSTPGARAAQAAGMTVVAIPSGATSGADFAFAGYLFGSLAEVVPRLDAILSGVGNNTSDTN